LGGYLLREAVDRGLEVTAWSGSRTGRWFKVAVQPVDFMQAAELAKAFQEVRPQVINHAAALADVEACRREPDRARRINTEATARLAELAAGAGARLLYVSTDLVFDGEKGNYDEWASTAPLSVYGQTKRDAEPEVLNYSQLAVARVSWLYGPTLTGREGFFDDVVLKLRTGSPLRLYDDEWRTPISLTVAAKALVGIALSDFAGTIHVGGPERMSRWEIGRRLAAYLGIDASGIKAARRASDPAPEPRPRDTSLDSSQWRSMFPNEPWPCFEEALGSLLALRAGA
jgi:dTDP-4-dehydrorhamnose reductase